MSDPQRENDPHALPDNLQDALHGALNMLAAISIGRTFDHAEYMRRVVSYEMALDRSQDATQAYLTFVHRACGL